MPRLVQARASPVGPRRRWGPPVKTVRWLGRRTRRAAAIRPAISDGSGRPGVQDRGSGRPDREPTMPAPRSPIAANDDSTATISRGRRRAAHARSRPIAAVPAVPAGAAGERV